MLPPFSKSAPRLKTLESLESLKTNALKFRNKKSESRPRRPKKLRRWWRRPRREELGEWDFLRLRSKWKLWLGSTTEKASKLHKRRPPKWSERLAYNGIRSTSGSTTCTYVARTRQTSRMGSLRRFSTSKKTSKGASRPSSLEYPRFRSQKKIEQRHQQTKNEFSMI